MPSDTVVAISPFDAAPASPARPGPDLSIVIPAMTAVPPPVDSPDAYADTAKPGGVTVTTAVRDERNPTPIVFRERRTAVHLHEDHLARNGSADVLVEPIRSLWAVDCLLSRPESYVKSGIGHAY